MNFQFLKYGQPSNPAYRTPANRLNIFGSRAFSTADGDVTQDESSLRVNTLKTGVYLNPHYSKKEKGGEDAATVTQNVIAVADGVGGWAESGVDPAKFSKNLCKIISGLCAYEEEKYMC